MKELDGIRIVPEGDLALLVEFENEISETCNRKVTALNETLKQASFKGIVEMVPAFRSLLIYYDPLKISYGKLGRFVKKCIKQIKISKSASKRIIHIPVCYEGEYGMDLEQVCEHAGLSKEEVIRIHTEKDYLIYMLGFLPGFPYLGGLDSRLEMSRLDNPRTAIPAGAVGIGGKQTGIYPLSSPGGWRLIGQTPLLLYDSTRENPILYQAGDYIRFEAIDVETYQQIERKVADRSFDYASLIED